MNKHKIVAIIPARGKSKRLPRKNVKVLVGKPMIVYSIEAAKRARLIDRVIVSTEDKAIAAVSRKAGAEVINRPGILATDTAKTVDVIFHVLDELAKENYFPDGLVLLQPTSPLRTGQDIDGAVKEFLSRKSASVVSVTEAPASFWWVMEGKKGSLKPVFGWKHFFSRSQDLPKISIPNGAIYVISPKTLKKYGKFYLEGRTYPFLMPQDRSIDIDYEIDFKTAEFILKNNK